MMASYSHVIEVRWTFEPEALGKHFFLHLIDKEKRGLEDRIGSRRIDCYTTKEEAGEGPLLSIRRGGAEEVEYYFRREDYEAMQNWITSEQLALAARENRNVELRGLEEALSKFTYVQNNPDDEESSDSGMHSQGYYGCWRRN